MNHNQATEMANNFKAVGGFSKIEVEHFGFFSQMTDEIKNDGRWEVHLWSVNSAAGNRNLHVISEFSTDEKEINLIAKKAKGKATARDNEALARMAAERIVNAE